MTDKCCHRPAIAHSGSTPNRGPQQIRTLDELRTTARTVIDVPNAAQLLGVSRTAAYEAARKGDIPSLRVGRRILIPVERLKALLGVGPESTIQRRDVDLSESRHWEGSGYSE